MMLRLKPFAVFWLIAGVTIVGQSMYHGVRIFDFNRNPLIVQFASFASIFCLVFRMVWLYQVATNLHSRLPDDIQVTLTLFKFAFYINIVDKIVISFTPLIYSFMGLGYESLNIYLRITTPLLVLSYIAVAYMYYFVARSLVSVELRRRTQLGEYIGAFFLFVFYPIGVFWLQPRINNIADAGLAHESNTPLDHGLN